MSKLKKPIIFKTAFSTYTAEEIIGEGGAGRVYFAYDEDCKDWAIKILDPAKATKEKLKRFKNEYMFCSKNKHKNILTVTDYGLHYDKTGSSAPFYIMPKYKCSMRKLISSKLQHDLILPYFGQILDGIEAAHLKSVIHRDLKPENILYDSQHDLLLIADFGVARFSEDELYTLVKTAKHTRLANYLYAAPEQRKPDLQVNKSADIYALGLILNEMFTNEIPQGTDFKTIDSIDKKYGYLDGIVSKMIKQNPDERYSSIEEVKRELIAKRNDFISQQRLSELRNEVIPVSDLDDPLIDNPPKLIDADWEDNILTLVLSQNVNSTWVWALQNMGSFTSLMGKEPGRFNINGNKAKVSAPPGEVEQIIKHFKDWLPKANKVYERHIIKEKNRLENEERLKLQNKIKKEELKKEVREKVKKNIKI